MTKADRSPGAISAHEAYTLDELNARLAEAVRRVRGERDELLHKLLDHEGASWRAVLVGGTVLVGQLRVVQGMPQQG